MDRNGVAEVPGIEDDYAELNIHPSVRNTHEAVMELNDIVREGDNLAFTASYVKDYPDFNKGEIISIVENDVHRLFEIEDVEHNKSEHETRLRLKALKEV